MRADIFNRNAFNHFDVQIEPLREVRHILGRRQLKQAVKVYDWHVFVKTDNRTGTARAVDTARQQHTALRIGRYGRIQIALWQTVVDAVMRVRNDRIKDELGVSLLYPNYRVGLKSLMVDS